MFKNRFVVDQNTGSLIGSKHVSSLLAQNDGPVWVTHDGITTFYGGLLPLNRPSYPILREGSDLGRDKRVNFGLYKINYLFFIFLFILYAAATWSAINLWSVQIGIRVQIRAHFSLKQCFLFSSGILRHHDVIILIHQSVAFHFSLNL